MLKAKAYETEFLNVKFVGLVGCTSCGNFDLDMAQRIPIDAYNFEGHV